MLQLSNLHGDVAATIDLTLSAPLLFDYDEYGVPVAAQADQRYGWLGGKQRSGEALGELILMGVRLYSPDLGRFLHVDYFVVAATRPGGIARRAGGTLYWLVGGVLLFAAAHSVEVLPIRWMEIIFDALLVIGGAAAVAQGMRQLLLLLVPAARSGTGDLPSEPGPTSEAS